MRIAIGRKNEQGHLSFGIVLPFGQPETVSLRHDPEATDPRPSWHAYVGEERIGAFWKKTSKAGLDYLNGQLESPVFPGGRISVSNFKATQEERKGEMDMTWQVPRDQPKAAAPNSSAAPGEAEDDIPF